MPGIIKSNTTVGYPQMRRGWLVWHPPILSFQCSRLQTRRAWPWFAMYELLAFQDVSRPQRLPRKWGWTNVSIDWQSLCISLRGVICYRFPVFSLDITCQRTENECQTFVRPINNIMFIEWSASDSNIAHCQNHLALCPALVDYFNGFHTLSKRKNLSNTRPNLHSSHKQNKIFKLI